MNNLNSLNTNLDNIDWDFPSFGNEGLNSFHWYPATFISAIPGSIIPILSKKNATILDTFCGTSVTGYEAIRLGRNYIGVDNNPIAILISKAKLLFPDTKALEKIFSGHLSNTIIGQNINPEHPNELLLKKWYYLDTYYELNNLLTIISKIENQSLRIPAQAVFSSILKKTSSQGKHWGWVCDNVVPKPTEIVYKNANEIFIKALRNFCNSVEETLSDIKNRNIDNRRKELRNNWRIECCDTLEFMNELEEKSVDLILTSPPYYGVADYVKAQRLSFLWFDKSIMSVENYSYEDFELLRKKETGPRSSRYKKSGFDEYISYMKEYISKCNSLLKIGSYFVLIMGDSNSRNATMDLIDQYTLEAGFVKEYNFQRQIRESKRRLMAKVKDEQIRVYVKK